MANKKKELTKEQRIKKELKRLKKVFEKIPENSKKSTEGLLENAAFIRITLQDLALDLRENGVTEMFSQSEKAAPYERTRPSSDLYNKLIVSYQKITKQLTDLLPLKDRIEVEKDDFDNFVYDRKDT